MYDLIIRGGRVIDPTQKLNGIYDVALTGGVVAEVAPSIEGRARRTLSADGLLVLPGLVDLHVHIHWGVSHYGVEPDLSCLAKGVTTAVDAGSAGGYTYPSLKRYIIDRSQTRLLAFLNIAYAGMIGDEVGELEDARFVNTELALRVGQAREIVGIKARMDRVGQRAAAEALRPAVEVAAALGKPVMVHIGRGERMHSSLAEILEMLRPGDLVTHCYHGHPGGIVDEEGRVRAEVWRARERGILYDVGHGGGSFTFAVARAALEQGLRPDIISSDLHTASIAGPVFDLPTTMSKFLHLGMDLESVVTLSTSAPAAILGLQDRLGTLRPGAEGDVCLCRLEQGAFPLYDCAGQREIAAQRLVPVNVVKGGQLASMGPYIA